MKIYKYKLKDGLSVKVFNEYLVETTFIELFGYGTTSNDKIIRFVFNDDNEIYEIDDEDNFLEALNQNLIKHEEVFLDIEIVRKLWNFLMDRKSLNEHLRNNDENLKIIWKEIHNESVKPIRL